MTISCLFAYRPPVRLCRSSAPARLPSPADTEGTQAISDGLAPISRATLPRQEEISPIHSSYHAEAPSVVHWSWNLRCAASTAFDGSPIEQELRYVAEASPG